MSLELAASGEIRPAPASNTRLLVGNAEPVEHDLFESFVLNDLTFWGAERGGCSFPTGVEACYAFAGMEGRRQAGPILMRCS